MVRGGSVLLPNRRSEQRSPVCMNALLMPGRSKSSHAAQGCPRTAFAQEFKRVVGETAIAYLTRWRMNLATPKLREKGQTLSAVADHIGYESPSAFRAAFRRFSGMFPKELVAAEQLPPSEVSR